MMGLAHHLSGFDYFLWELPAIYREISHLGAGLTEAANQRTLA